MENINNRALGSVFGSVTSSVNCHHSTQTKTEGSFADSLQESMDAASGSTGATTNVEHHTPSQQPAQGSTSEGNTTSKEPTQPTEHHTTTYAADSQQTVQTRQAAAQKTVAAVEVNGVRYPAGMFIIQFETADGDTAKSEKELADLLANTEEMLGAPQRMQETLKGLVLQAFNELNDPEMSEEEFTEMVLDFLMEYIDKEFGGEIDSTSIFADDEDDDSDIHDVLLQAVVQMLEEIRSENAEAPAETETIEEVGAIPASDMPNENANVTASELLGDEAKEIDGVIEAVAEAEPAERNEAPQTANVENTERTDAEDANTAAIRAAEQAAVNTVTVYQAAAQAAESIYAAVTQPHKTESEPIQPVRSERSVSVIQPADELEELTRLVKGGDTVKSERTETQLLFDQSEKQETEEIPEVKLEAIGETVPFEAAIARSVPQATLTNSLSDVGSGAQQVVSQIASEIFNNLSEAGNGTTTFVMTLNPESLGKVTVKMVEEAGKLSVTVTAHNRHAAELLSDRFENLQAAMKDNGTQLEKYQVVYAPEKNEGSNQHNFDGSSKNPYVRQDSEEGEGGTEFAELLQDIV